MSYTKFCSPVFFLSIGALAIWGCGGPSARVRNPGEPSLVGDRRAGAETYYNLLDGALKDLSQTYRDANGEEARFQKIRLAFFGVDNKTNEELGAWRDHIKEIIVDRLDKSGDFEVISFDRFIKPALDRARVNPVNLFIPDDRRKFLAVLEQSNSPVDAFLYSNLTQGDTKAGGIKQSDYLLTFELMNPDSGQILRAQRMISKEYYR